MVSSNRSPWRPEGTPQSRARLNYVEQQTVYCYTGEELRSPPRRPPSHCQTQGKAVVPPTAPHFPSWGAQSPSTAFCFQPTAINAHSLVFNRSHRRGTQAAHTFNFFLTKSRICDALSPLCHLTARAFARHHPTPACCQCCIPITTAESTALSHSTPPSHHRPLWDQLAPSLCSAAGAGRQAWQEPLDHGRTRPTLLPSSLVPTGWL